MSEKKDIKRERAAYVVKSLYAYYLQEQDAAEKIGAPVKDSFKFAAEKIRKFFLYEEPAQNLNELKEEIFCDMLALFISVFTDNFGGKL